MDKISPTPYHVQGQVDKVTLANFQFGYLVYLLKLSLLGLLLITPVTVWLSSNIADIQVNAGKLRSDVHQLTDSVNALVKNQKSMLNRFKITSKVIDAIEASLDALVLDIPVQTALSTRIAVASEAQQQLLIEYLPTIAGFDPTLKAIQVAVEESSSVATDIAADLALVEAATTSAAADLTALLAAFGEYATVMEPIVSVITGDLSAVVGDYFNPIFKLGGWHIRSIHSNVDVTITKQPISVQLSAPITIPPIQLPPIVLPPGFVLPVTVTNPFVLPTTVPVSVSNPFTLPAVIPVSFTQTQPIVVTSPPSASLNVTVFNPFVLPAPFPVIVTNSPAVMIANEDPIGVMLDQDLFVQLPDDATVAVSNPFVLPDPVNVKFNSAESIFRTEVIAPEIFSVAVMNFPNVGSDGCPCSSAESPHFVQVSNFPSSIDRDDYLDVQTDAHINSFFVRPISIPYTQIAWFVAEFQIGAPTPWYERLKKYLVDFVPHIHNSMKLEFDLDSLGGCPGHISGHVYGKLSSSYVDVDDSGYKDCADAATGIERLFRRNTHHNANYS